MTLNSKIEHLKTVILETFKVADLEAICTTVLFVSPPILNYIENIRCNASPFIRVISPTEKKLK